MKGVGIKMSELATKVPAIHVLNFLMYNGELVGYRVKLKGVLFDVSVEDYDLILNDMKPPKINRDDIVPTYVDLIEEGTNLVPVGLPAAQELLYKDFARYIGLQFMGKTDTELKRLYNKYNREIFNDRLATFVAVEWSTRMTTTAGICKRITKDGVSYTLIQLSVSYHETNPNELMDTLVHEMIHVLLPKSHHGSPFLEEARRINEAFGMNITVYAHGEIDYKYIYECVECSQKYERMRRLDLSRARCGVCRGKLYLVFEN